MTLVRNPFDAGGYSLAEMTRAINILPNLYTRLAQIGLFRFEGVSQRSVIIEQYEGVLSLLPSVPLGGPATVGTREGRSMRSFALPWIPHDDVVLPADVQGQPALGGAFDAADPLVEVMNRKLLLMRRKHAQTREYNLAERFGIPPFSVFEARKGWWQDRKRAWLDLGIRSELGRGAAPGGAPRPLDRGWSGEKSVPAVPGMGTADPAPIHKDIDHYRHKEGKRARREAAHG